MACCSGNCFQERKNAGEGEKTMEFFFPPSYLDVFLTKAQAEKRDAASTYTDERVIRLLLVSDEQATSKWAGRGRKTRAGERDRENEKALFRRQMRRSYKYGGVASLIV